MVDDYHSRQSFLGPLLPEALAERRICVVGVSGGGSHIVQQAAHIGFRRFLLYDPDVIEEPNLHRHVGARRKDVEDKRPKVEIGKRVILDVQPRAQVEAIQSRWQERVGSLRRSDLIFGCIDGLRERLDLEAAARRYLIPYVDIGLGVSAANEGSRRMAGQVVLSVPDGPCFRCLGVITEKDLARESSRYGDLGPNPQVVWANGVLASTAMGLALDFLTAWSANIVPDPFLEVGAHIIYEGNECRTRAAPCRPFSGCSHYPATERGDPKVRTLLAS